MSFPTITDSERAVLIALVTNHYSAGEDAGGATWAYCVNDATRPSGIEGKALGGVISSLRKKGFVYCDGAGRDAVIGWKVPEAFAFAAELAFADKLANS